MVETIGKWLYKGAYGLSAIVLLFLLFLSSVPAQTQKTSTSLAALNAAAEAVKRQEFERAGELAKTVLATEPRNAEAHITAGLAADGRGDLVSADRHFSEAIRLKPLNAAFRNNYGALLARMGQREAAIAEFRRSINIDPAQVNARVNLAQILFENGTSGDLKISKELFEAALKLKPDVEVARAIVVISLRLRDNLQASKEHIRYRTLAEGTSQPVEQLLELGSALLSARLFTEAIIEGESALAIEKYNVTGLVLTARAYLGLRDIKAAGRILEAAVAGGVGDASVFSALADVYQAGGFIENAIPVMRLAVEKNPKDELLKAKYGLLLMDSNAPAAAVIRLKEYCVLFPGSIPIWLALGIAQLADGKNVEARSSFERLLLLDERSVPAMAYLATIFEDAGDFAEAVKWYRKAIAAEGDSAYLHFLLADTLAKLPISDSAEIAKHLKLAALLDPTLAGVHLALGKLHLHENNFIAATLAFETAAKNDPLMAEAYYQLGRVLTRLKRKGEAEAAFAKHKELTQQRAVQKETTRREYARRLANVRF
jgi:Tfp pilus assembly protein PilF